MISRLQKPRFGAQLPAGHNGKAKVPGAMRMSPATPLLQPFNAPGPPTPNPQFSEGLTKAASV